MRLENNPLDLTVFRGTDYCYICSGLKFLKDCCLSIRVLSPEKILRENLKAAAPAAMKCKLVSLGADIEDPAPQSRQEVYIVLKVVLRNFN